LRKRFAPLKGKLLGSEPTVFERSAVDLGTIETIPSLSQESPEPITGTEAVFPLATQPESRLAKDDIRQSLHASTLDGVFAAVFSNVAGGVLLSNFLIELDASPVQVGMLASIPMLANLMQPIGAWISDRTSSRHNYCFWIYFPSRLIWFLLLGAIGLFITDQIDAQLLIWATLSTVFTTHMLGAFGSAAWLSWLAAIVPRRLRGRYFSVRNSAANLTCLISIPLAGFLVSVYPKGSIDGYGVVLCIGIIAGLISLAFQWKMTDVNPQEQKLAAVSAPQTDSEVAVPSANANFIRFLIYFGVWMFAVNLSAPFFNLYMLDNLEIDVSLVTLYNSLTAGANLLMLIFWGKLADRVGNRFLLLMVGVLVALTPMFWLGTGSDALSLWLWLPLLHILAGGTWAAIDLCNNNIQLGIAPQRNQATYFAIAAAIAGVSGALGTTAGGFIAQFANYGGLLGLFLLSSIVRLIALFPLMFVHEERGQSVKQMLNIWLAFKQKSEDLQLSEKP
jgi:MFS family permease